MGNFWQPMSLVPLGTPDLKAKGATIFDGITT